uniref:Uncharacterized protein n=1 Tax=Nelumbo nucifera TaxID=4432 RepID=A0A822XU49_NELNU|nr:TPA_asm: hypothetical protein HUJ06_024985 [Nelumbo nucifera]
MDEESCVCISFDAKYPINRFRNGSVYVDNGGTLI